MSFGSSTGSFKTAVKHWRAVLWPPFYTHSCLQPSASICVDFLGQNSMRCAGVSYLYIDYESRGVCTRPPFSYNPKCKATGSSDYVRNESLACFRLACQKASEESGSNDFCTVILLYRHNVHHIHCKSCTFLFCHLLCKLRSLCENYLFTTKHRTTGTTQFS